MYVRWGSEIPRFVINLVPGPFSPHSITNLLFDSGTLLAPVDHSTSYSALTLPSTSHLPCYGNPLGPSGSLFLLRSELERLHDRLHRLEFGDAAASTPRGHAWRSHWDGARWGSAPTTPAPTPAIIAVGHTTIPLAETLPTAEDSPSRYSCTLVVPDSVVGHIVGRGGKGLHQSHDVSGAQLRAYTDKASPLERRVSIRGTDQQVGEALIALGKRFMRKRIRSKKKGPSRPSGDLAPPPPSPALVSLDVSSEGACPLKKRAHPPYLPLAPASVRPPPAASAQLRPVGAAIRPRKSGVRFAPQESSYHASHSLPHIPATTSIPTQVMASPIPTPHPSSTPHVPSVAMPTAVPSPSPRSAAPSPMAIDAVRPERGRRQQTARRGGAVSASDARIDSQGNLLFRGDPEF
ncbi:hypothetical protein R3P38DRAFT_3588402 [Favolaschia claudopus]|uniref:K Homology domain-containing protein n=1 Tax=Favolaschia claudopus TaxID=2862362 RepID=A0AAW0AHL1_9AGAR